MLDPIALLQSLTLPAGATTGQRIVLNGQQGNIQIFNSANQLVVLIDPVGFIEIFHAATGTQLATMDDLGFSSFSAAGNLNARMSNTGLTIFDVNGNIVGNWDATGFNIQVVGEAFARFVIDSLGVHTWGPGNIARDVNLYRGGIDILKTDDTFNAVIDVQRNGISLPRGVVAYQQLTANDVARAAGVNTDMTVTFTADATRLYEIALKSNIAVGTLSATYALNLSEGGTVGVNDGTAVDRFLRINTAESAVSPVHRTASLLYLPTAGAKTIRVRSDAGSGGTVTLQADGGAGIGSRSLTVKDIGPR